MTRLADAYQSAAALAQPDQTAMACEAPEHALALIGDVEPLPHASAPSEAPPAVGASSGDADAFDASSGAGDAFDAPAQPPQRATIGDRGATTGRGTAATGRSLRLRRFAVASLLGIGLAAMAVPVWMHWQDSARKTADAGRAGQRGAPAPGAHRDAVAVKAAAERAPAPVTLPSGPAPARQATVRRPAIPPIAVDAPGMTASATTRDDARVGDSAVQPVEAQSQGASPPGATAPRADDSASTPVAVSSTRMPPASAEQAWQKLQQGQIEEAASDYDHVLHANPDNADALLGLAAIALRRGDRRLAARHFTAVLRIEPHHPHARAGLLGLAAVEDPHQTELLLLQTLAHDPDAPLYFQLGNLYAAHGNWMRAQEAWFHAHRLESTNLDYTYNLAVALDHLGQRSAALRLYRLAIPAGGDAPTGFDRAQVERRIARLTAEQATAEHAH